MAFVCQISTVQYGMTESTMSAILTYKEVIKVGDFSKGVTVINQQWPKMLEEVEKLLLIFINEKKQTTVSVKHLIVRKF